MKIAISAESTIDLTKELLEKYDIKTIPFIVLLGEKEGYDGEITPKEIFDYVDQTAVLPKTSAINDYNFEEYFKNLLNEYDAVVHVSLSSAISSTYQHANIAAGKLRNVYVVDSKSLSTGIALLCIYGRELAEQGLAANEIAKQLRARTKAVQASFVVNTIDYLFKGGRCSSLQRFGANLLRLKPQIVVNNDGKMSSGKKYRGKNRDVVDQYCMDTLAKFNNPDKSIVFVTHSLASQDMVDCAIEILQRHGFKTIYTTVAGATISSHCGPKTLGILYFNDGGKIK